MGEATEGVGMKCVDRNNRVGGEGVRGRTDKTRSGETEEARRLSPSDTLSCLAPGRRRFFSFTCVCVCVCPRDELHHT